MRLEVRDLDSYLQQAGVRDGTCSSLTECGRIEFRCAKVPAAHQLLKFREEGDIERRSGDGGAPERCQALRRERWSDMP